LSKRFAREWRNGSQNARRKPHRQSDAASGRLARIKGVARFKSSQQAYDTMTSVPETAAKLQQKNKYAARGEHTPGNEMTMIASSSPSFGPARGTRR